MKKFLCVLISIVVLTASVPLSAFAGRNADYVLQANRVSYLNTLSGMKDGAPDWHDGMGITADMNGKQVYTALTTLQEQTLLPALNLLEALVANDARSGLRHPDVDQLLARARAINEEIETCRQIIDYDREYIYYKVEELGNNVYTTEHEVEAVAFQIVERGEELDQQIDYAADRYDEWKEFEQEILSRLQTPDDNTPQTGALDILQSHIVGLKQDYSRDLLEYTSDIASEERAGGSGIILDIVDVEHVAIIARYNEKPLPGAKITVWSQDKERQYTATADENGKAEFLVLDLKGDKDHYVHFGWEVTAAGYQTQYSEMGLRKGGNIIYADLTPVDPDRDVYVAGVSFNGRDCLYDQVTLYITSQNDADQKVTAHLRTVSGKAPSGTLTMKAKDKSGKTITEESPCSGKTEVTFSGKWCSLLAAGEGSAFTFEYRSGAQTNETPLTVSPQIATQKAVYEKPTFMQDASKNIFAHGVEFSFAKSVRFLDKLKLNIDFNPLPMLRVFGDVSGSWLVGYTSGEKQLPEKLQKYTEPDCWKTADTKDVEEAATLIAEYTGRSVKEEANKIKKNMANDRQSSFFGGTKAFWGGAFAASGKIKPKSEKYQVTLSLSAGITVGFKGDWVKTVFAGPVPIAISFGFSLSAGATVQLDNELETISRPDFTDVTFFIPVDFHFTFNFNASLYGGIGFGSSPVSAGLKFTSSFSGSIPLIHTNEDLIKKSTTLEFSLGLSLYVKVKIVFVTITATYNLYSGGIKYEKGKWGDWQNKPFWKEDKKLTGASGALNGAPGEDPAPKYTEHQDDLNGRSLWSYDTSGLPTGTCEPKLVSLSGALWFRSYNTNFAFYINENSEVCYINIDQSAHVAPKTVPLPDDAARKIRSGEWIVTDIGASCSPKVFEWGSVYKCQVAAVSVVCATKWTTEQQVLEEGKTVEVIKPLESTVLTKLFSCGADQAINWLPAPDGSVSGFKDLTFVMKTRIPVSHVIPFVYDVQPELKLTMSGIQLYVSPKASPSVLVCGYSKNGDTGNYISIYDGEKDNRGYARVTDRVLNAGQPVRILQTPGATHEMAFILTEKDELYALNGNGGYITDLTGVVTDDITDIAVIGAKDAGTMTLFLSVEDAPNADEVSHNKLKALTVREMQPYRYVNIIDRSDLDVKCATRIDAGNLLSEPTVYWFETFTDRDAPNKPRTRVQGMIYAPDMNLITGAYTLGVLNGNDGTPPKGYLVPSEPIMSAVLSNGNLFMVRSWLHDQQASAAAFEKNRYAYDVIRVNRQVKPDAMAVSVQNPVCSAGGSCMMDLQVINRGNVPVIGFTADVYVQEQSGPKLVETIRIDLKNSGNNLVSFMEDGDIGDLDTAAGESAVRRIPGLFDRINNDEWNVTREKMMTVTPSDGNGTATVRPLNEKSSEFISVPVMMPGAVQLFTAAFHIPADWSGKKSVTVVIRNALVPSRSSDIFRSGKGGGQVLLVEMDPASNDPEKCSVLPAGTYDDYSFEPLSSAANETPDEAYLYDSDTATLVFDTAELDIDYRLFSLNGEDCITFTVAQRGSTDNAQPRGFQIRAYCDGNSAPSFVHTFKTHPDDSRVAYSVTVPVMKLTNGKQVDSLMLETVDTVTANSELTTYNNSHVFLLNKGLRITEQPQNITIEVKGTGILSVQAEGGTSPYHYQWQKLKNGKWNSVSGANAPELSLELAKKDDGSRYRCVITDAAGTQVISTAALITVHGKRPPTGDPFTWFWGAALMVSAAGMLLLCVKRKRHGTR